VSEEGRTPGDFDWDEAEIPEGVTEGYPDAAPFFGVRAGPSPRSGYVRLYLTLDLRQYCEVPREKVRGLTKTASGRRVLWIERDARVDFGGVTSRSVEFLEGDLQRRFQRRTVGMAGLVGVAARAVGGAAAGGSDSACICFDTDNRTEQCPGTNCGMCPGTFSDCP
jgi:hypothetical protein